MQTFRISNTLAVLCSFSTISPKFFLYRFYRYLKIGFDRVDDVWDTTYAENASNILI
jgi:hypothetical protein